MMIRNMTLTLMLTRRAVLEAPESSSGMKMSGSFQPGLRLGGF